MKAQSLIEMVSGDDLKHLVDTIFGMAEENAYDLAASEQRNVSGDDIFNEAKAMLQTVEDAISDRLQQATQK